MDNSKYQQSARILSTVLSLLALGVSLAYLSSRHDDPRTGADQASHSFSGLEGVQEFDVVIRTVKSASAEEFTITGHVIEGNALIVLDGDGVRGIGVRPAIERRKSLQVLRVDILAISDVGPSQREELIVRVDLPPEGGRASFTDPFDGQVLLINVTRRR